MDDVDDAWQAIEAIKEIMKPKDIYLNKNNTF